MQNFGIVRNPLKIQLIIKNAKAYLAVETAGMTFSDYIWQFVDGKTIINNWSTKSDVPTSTEHSDKMTKKLKQQGFSFVRTTICYAFMQAVGMVNDHTSDCFCYHSRVLDVRC